MWILRLLLLTTFITSFTLALDQGGLIDPNGGGAMDPNGARVCYTACIDPNG